MIEPIASKDEILTAIRNALFASLLKSGDNFEFNDEDKDDARKTVNRFIEERLRPLGAAELLARFDTAEKILDHYAAYLETRLRVGPSTIH